MLCRVSLASRYTVLLTDRVSRREKSIINPPVPKTCRLLNLHKENHVVIGLKKIWGWYEFIPRANERLVDPHPCKMGYR